MKQKRIDTVPSEEKYEEYKVLPQFWGWVLLLGFSASLIAWAMWLHLIVPERPRQWDYGTPPFTPAESIYSTAVLPEGMKPVRQVETLPEAEPLHPPPAGRKEEK